MLLIWGTLGALTKPSYIMAFVPAFGLMALFKHGWGKRSFEAVAVCALLLVPLMLQKSAVYSGDGEDKVEFSFFEVWQNYHYSAPDPVLSLLTSIASCLALPLCVLLWRRELIKDTLVQFAALGFVVAFLISGFLMESGPRMLHGNFGWQVPVSCYLLYWSLGIRTIRRGGEGMQNRFWGWCAAFLATAHVISGLAYVWRGWSEHRYQ